MEKYDAIVLPSGGVNGFAILGCLQNLMDNNYLNNVNTYVGTSVGSIISLLMCLGYKPSEIFVHVWQSNLIEKLQNSISVCNLLNNRGIIEWSIIEIFIKELIEKKIDSNITLKELYEKFNKNLVCCTYNYTQNKVEYINYENYPNIKCVEVIRMSSNIPIIFDSYKYKDNYYIDGAIYSTFPIHYLDIKKYKILGIKINFQKDMNLEYSNIVNIIYNIFYIIMNHVNKILNENHEKENKIIEIILNKPQDLNFMIKINEAMELFSIGYKS